MLPHFYPFFIFSSLCLPATTVERGPYLLPVNRLLAREGINAEQLARDLKSFELKVIAI